jgi:4-hydroxy-tetrahydrodipicolinate reductase
MPRTRVLLFGLGQVGLIAARQLRAENYDIVAAISRDAHVGQDLGMILGSAPSGLLVSSARDFDPKSTPADVALFFTTGSAYDLLDAPVRCLEAGINVVTVAEGATYPWTYDAELSAQIDAAARRGGATITSTGITDTYMVHMAAVLASTVPAVRRIVVTSMGDFGRLGPCALGGMPLGLKPDEFAQLMQAPPLQDAKPPASICGQCLEALAALMKLTAGPIAASLDLKLAERDLPVATLGRTLKAGTISGLIETVEMRTAEGIELAILLTAEIFAEDKPEVQRITVHSADHPVPLSLEVGPTPGVEYTAAIAINRIHDVIAAPPGFQTIDRLPAPLFRPANRQ